MVKLMDQTTWMIRLLPKTLTYCSDTPNYSCINFLFITVPGTPFLSQCLYVCCALYLECTNLPPNPGKADSPWLFRIQIRGNYLDHTPEIVLHFCCNLCLVLLMGVPTWNDIVLLIRWWYVSPYRMQASESKNLYLILVFSTFLPQLVLKISYFYKKSEVPFEFVLRSLV